MKLPVPVLLAAVFFCGGLSADQALFRNASISFGDGSVLDMKTADVNHDGKQDVILFQAVTASQTACSIITMFGNGDGTFRAPVKTPIASCGSVAFGDLDSDGNVDVVLSGYDRLIEVYRGNNDGSFTLRSTKNRAGSILYSAPNLLLSDLNGDGKIDLISPAGCCQQTETFRGNGDGTFADGVLQPDFATAITGIVAGDFDGDGRTDMLVTSRNGGLSLITGKGDGNFNAPTVLSTEGALAAAGDFNGDLKTDYVAGAASGPAAGYHSYSATYNGNVNTDPVSSTVNSDYAVDAAPCTPASNCVRRRAVH
ncbi:MAG: VCBS repeat-containing protein [Acidobacteria bacterium]|nr:VCBS repeat-containing protein [Acidobacteriota bacterium]MBV9068702.1 VCBS repeat-containing protein [Acidobacteriota bacterium]MBV9188113.1 VCBS repeat-containing protein [Acidobacteriota bacterium]